MPLLTRIRPTVAGPEAGVATKSALMRKADRYLLIAMVLAGTWIAGVLAIPFMAIAFVYMARAQARGELSRPWSVTIIGTFCLIDAAANANWSYDLFFGGHTDLVKTLFGGYGKLVDGAYYIDYNALHLGGVANPGEKSYEIWGTLVLYPARIAACWGFLQMRRWGLQAMIVTSFLYLGFWVGYMANSMLDFSARAGAGLLGQTGQWVVLLFYASPFIVMPYLFSVNRAAFIDER